ncbi:MAG: hypothetical protein DRP29_06215 [Thermodesulfobacteriota bacterium]|nr:MAG: hypothetical protein DRP29_06215 [Thermodesulfobacteriota bacterium]
MLKKLIELVRGKRVMLCTHWDADGVASGALIYHIIKPFALEINTVSKGKPFQIMKEDISEGSEVIICTDIQPSSEVLDMDAKIAYIDHHPFDAVNKVDFAVYDPDAQSAASLIFEKLMPDTNNPYFVFLALLGYFGDQGDRDAIPDTLRRKAFELIPELMQKRQSYYSDSYYYDIERYVSLLNTGKRRNWNGDIPLELLKTTDHYEPIVMGYHPLMEVLHSYKMELKSLYEQDVEVMDFGVAHCIIISNKKNIQGVLAAKHMKDKPIMVLNTVDDEVIGSLRVPDGFEFDAGSFLSAFNGKIEGFLGGGHEKAAGFTFSKKHLDLFLSMVKGCKTS